MSRYQSKSSSVYLSDQLKAMKKLENGPYECIDYLSMLPNDDETFMKCNISCSSLFELSTEQMDDELEINYEVYDDVPITPIIMSKSPASIIDVTKSWQSTSPIYCSDYWRMKEVSEKILPIREDMCKWAFEVVDSYSMNRESVFLAFSYLDRYAVRVESISSENYVLACMTCLYISVKVMFPKKKPLLSWFVEMSRRAFTRQDFISMELDILHTLDWKINPPTPMTFLRIYLKSYSVYFQKCCSLLEQMLQDHYFIPKRSSVIALAVILVVFDDTVEFEEIKDSILQLDPHALNSDVSIVKDYIIQMEPLNNAKIKT